VKLVQKSLYFIFIFLLVGCNVQPLSSTLLSAGQSTSGDSTVSDPTEDENGQLEIRGDNTDISAMIEDTDKIEITGSCNDLNRKKNRIIVEAFSGEDENAEPYISNSISDFCQQSTVLSGFPSTGNGTSIGSECFWVTKGIGVVEDANIPTARKSYPQCHNGRFSFAIRLGGVLTTPAPGGSRYLVRFKIRTLEGQISESNWSCVYVTRKLAVPSIDEISQNDNLYFCQVKMSPARFNPFIQYTLRRDQVGASTIPSINLMVSQTSTVITGNSAYNYLDDTAGSANIISGATYSYTLMAGDATTYSGGFAYSPGLVQTSEVKTCTISKPTIEQPFAPTNTPISVPDGKGPSCYLQFSSQRIANPGIANGTVTLRWAYSTTPNWTNGNSDYNGSIPGVSPGGATILSAVSCATNSTACTSTLLGGDALVADTTYYFAAQEIDALNGLRGKWSNEISCKPPQPN
jgi:hypothetical protein